MRAQIFCALILAGTGALLTGCLDRDLKPLNPCTVSGVVENVAVSNVDKVDMLFMIDNSNSMTEEQASLAEQLPRLMTILATGDLNQNGVEDPEDFPPVRSLQVGVITSDMGTGGFNVPTCEEPNFGDDGILRTQGNTSIEGCSAAFPKFLTFMPGGGQAPADFAKDFQCVAQMGTGGCGFEQQLEAVLKAVTPSTSDITFNMGTRGHADRENMGFVRPDSLLAVVLLTDEEDCSAAEPELFNPSSSTYSGNLNLRCFSYPMAVHPVERFVDGFLATRDNPDLFVYAAITGVPPDLVATDADASNYTAILDDSRMQEMVDPTDANRLAPSCNVPGRGVAFPPRRIVRVAQQLTDAGSNAVIQSICQEDFAPALDQIIAKIAQALGGACLPRDLVPDASGMVGCDVVEVLPTEGEFTQCSSIPGRELVRMDAETNAEVCRVAQLPVMGTTAPEGQGWFYDYFTMDTKSKCGQDGQRIRYTPGNEPKTGTLVRLECLQPVQQIPGTEAGDITIGSPCSSGCGAVGGFELSCDAQSNTCQQGCGNDADCSARGLAGWKCGDGFCQNPTCS